MDIFWIWLIVGAVSCAGICAAIGQRKNLDVTESAFWGFFLGIFGIIVVVFQSPELPAAPEGMAAVKCPRCNAVQNVSHGQIEYECWQCHQTNPITIAVPIARTVSTAPKHNVRCPSCQILRRFRPMLRHSGAHTAERLSPRTFEMRALVGLWSPLPNFLGSRRYSRAHVQRSEWPCPRAASFRKVARHSENPNTQLLAGGLAYLAEAIRELELNRPLSG
jgi:DNA-directed RNA polymerase subunit RPC12/RpoP